MHPIGDSVHRALLTHVLTRHAVGLTSAAVTLLGRRMYVEAAPLIRQTLECAVTAAWTVLTPHSVEALADESARQRLAMEADLDAFAHWGGFDSFSHGPTDAEAAAMEAFLAHRTTAARKFEERCRALPEAPWLYVYYRWLSQYSHATTHLLDIYIRSVPQALDEPETMRFAHTSEFEHPDLLAEIQVLVLLLALSAWDAGSKGTPNRPALAQIAEELNVSWTRLYETGS